MADFPALRRALADTLRPAFPIRWGEESKVADRILAALRSPEPAVADELLALALEALGITDEHYIEFDENGWFIEHSIECRIKQKLKCDLNGWARMLDGPPATGLGRYRAETISADERRLVPVEREDGK